MQYLHLNLIIKANKALMHMGNVCNTSRLQHIIGYLMPWVMTFSIEWQNNQGKARIKYELLLIEYLSRHVSPDTLYANHSLFF